MPNIIIKYPDGRYDEVNPLELDELILKGYVESFQRATGWVVVGKYNIRSVGGKYKGRERRQVVNQKN